MVKGLQRSISRGEKQTARIVTDRIRIRGATVSIDGTAQGFGTFVAQALPEGNIVFIGAVGYLTATRTGTNISATFDGDFSIGTAPTADATLDAAEVDLIPSTTIAQATAGISPRQRAVSATATSGTVHDNTAGTLEINCNILIDDADISATENLLVDLDLDITYIVLGDD